MDNAPRLNPPFSSPTRPSRTHKELVVEPLPTDGQVEDTELEEELLTHGDYPTDIREVTPLEEEDAEDLIDYLLSNSPEDLQP